MELLSSVVGLILVLYVLVSVYNGYEHRDDAPTFENGKIGSFVKDGLNCQTKYKYGGWMGITETRCFNQTSERGE